MSVHGSIIKVLVSLGYTITEGCCHGVSLRWIEACLLNEEHLFNRRIILIDAFNERLIHRIDAAKKKKGNHLTTWDHESLDILAFYDSLELYQFPYQHASLFNAPLMQNDMEHISNFSSSSAIQSRGGLARIYSEPGIYTKNEIKEYLDGLGVVIENVCVQSKEPLGMVLSSHNHTIALTYTPGKEWKLMDINQYPSESFKLHETNLLANRIMTAFKQSNSPYRAFHVSVFTTGNQLELLNLKETFDPFKKSHQLTKDIAGREELNGVGLALIAAQTGHASVISKLAIHGVDLNQADKDGVTLAYVAALQGHASVIAELALHKAIGNGAIVAFNAAQNGHVSVIAELAKHQVDLNQANKNGATPALIAAQNGHVSVIAELAKHQVNLNQSDLDGITPVYIAAQNGHASVIAELAQHGGDLNQANKNGITPAYIAVQNGHAFVLAELAKYKVDLNQAISGGATLAIIAAQQGHASVIAELAKQKVNLHKADNNGITPAYIAAQNGHASVIVELITAGVNFNVPYSASVDSFRQLAIPYGKHVIERMAVFIDQQLIQSPSRQTMTMTPYHIAEVMGHKDIMQLLSNNKEQDPNEWSNASSQPMEQPQNGNHKTLGDDGYTFFSSSVKECLTNNGVKGAPQGELSKATQQEHKKRKLGEFDDQASEGNANKKSCYRLLRLAN